MPLPFAADGHMLGYAFVQFTSFFEAARAITAVNGSTVKGQNITHITAAFNA